jgi:hypothetical protein
MTFGRWIAACVFGIALVAVTLLPPGLSDGDPYFFWRPPSRNTEFVMSRRARIRAQHGQSLWYAYQSARDVETAMRVFGAQSAKSSGPQDPVVWFDSDVPALARLQVNNAIAAERAARGAWRGHGAVGVLVFTDTATTIGGVPMSWGTYAGNTVMTQLIPPSKSTGDRCVTVIKLGRHAAHGEAFPDGRLLDGCAFYDAFGAPGPAIAAWLAQENFRVARSLSFAPPDMVRNLVRPTDYEAIFDNASLVRCAGGDLAACPSLMHRDQSRPIYYSDWYGGPDRSIPPSDESSRRFNSLGGSSYLEALMRDLGPGRFQHMWQSTKSLEDGYFEATGEPLAAWLHRQTVMYDGAYHIGPLPTPTSALLTMIAVLALAAASVRWAVRPYAA